MKTLGFALAALLMAGTAAQADTCFMTNIPGTLNMNYTLPSGEKKTAQIFPGQNGAPGQGQTTGVPDIVKKFEVSITDDVGTPVWHGTVKNYACTVLNKGADGHISSFDAGWWINDMDQPHALVLVNLSGQPVKLALLGSGGVRSVPGVALSPGTDAKLIRLPADDYQYYPQFEGADKSQTAMGVGLYFLVYKTDAGTFEVQQAGYMKSHHGGQ